MKLTPRKRTIVFAVLTAVTVVYMIAAWFITVSASDGRMCQGILITVHDTSEIHFVSPQELSAELGTLPQTARNTLLKDIDIDSLERVLNRFDKIERVNVNILTSGKILIDVWPMRPVARIFDSAGHSYYINRDGKRIVAAPGYFLDVPVVTGDFSPSFPATELFPLLDYLEANPEWGEAVSMIEARSPNDIVVVPVIRGHVINLGNTDNLPDKFNRLKLMYSKVMSAKGWDFYKEISVKWRGQVVGIRRNARERGPEYLKDELNDEEVNISTVELDGGKSTVQSEKPIPAARVRTDKAPEPHHRDSAAAKAPKTEKNNKNISQHSQSPLPDGRKEHNRH